VGVRTGCPRMTDDCRKRLDPLVLYGEYLAVQPGTIYRFPQGVEWEDEAEVTCLQRIEHDPFEIGEAG